MLKIGMCKLPHRMATSPSSQRKSSSRAGYKCNREFAGWEKDPQDSPSRQGKGEEYRKAGILSWHVCPGRKGARLREQRQFLLPLSFVELL